ncbi:NERD domain-containing protein [Hyphomonas pacifica]|uniref:DNA 3'-5' helicase II n=1 Tax=Hyphomonas pacifica TaxID=1280941 RepID=A0A062TTC5_9PROT|nr:NERD domain-containing protein [Hyphomonas pacifica]KCZ51231.1 hypothetical protein HY2_11795 [Hyphomonas pacifica]RAN33514.1 hypothetical protein HY3_12705 [Hyphomonas pacifica]
MATVHSRPIAGRDEPSELKAFDALATLNDEWHIFHSVAWIGVRGRRVGDGEADFVLVHARHGAVVVEVKGGGIAIESGCWRSTGKHGEFEIKDPYRQATASKSALHKWFDKQHGLKLPTCHCVLFPDYSNLAALGPHAPPEITVTPRDFVGMDDKLTEILRTWGLAANLSSKDIGLIISALAPKTSARRTLADEAFDAHRTLVDLTQEQIRAFAGMRRNRRAVVFGGAGTGKTILAMEKAAEFEEQNGNVLVLCYNKLLASRLKKDPRLRLATVATFHGLCIDEMRKAGIPFSANPDREWWERKAAECLVEALATNGNAFDAIVIDEGQDFAREWIDAIEVAGAHGADTPFYIFADENQTLWPRNWTPEADWPVYELSVNCRNTDQIARRLDPIVKRMEVTRGAQGPDTKWTEITRADRATSVAARAVERLLAEGFSSSEICVICEHHDTARQLREMSVGDEIFGAYGSGGIVVETIARFKGLEAPAVVLILEGGGCEPDIEAYVGFSRASTYLQVIGPPARKKGLGWS